jgi:hypothetical protein
MSENFVKINVNLALLNKNVVRCSYCVKSKQPILKQESVYRGTNKRVTLYNKHP